MPLGNRAHDGQAQAAAVAGLAGVATLAVQRPYAKPSLATTGKYALIAAACLARIFHRSRATNEYGIALVCPKIQVSNLDQRAGNAEAKLYRRN